MARVGRFLGTAAATAAVVLAVAVVGFLLVAPRVLGGATLTVLTGSMSPTIPPGSVVLIRPVEDPSALAPGDVITFQAAPTTRSLITHRVVRFQPDTTPPSYVTKGDANAGADIDPVPVGAIRGEVVTHVPYLGYAADRLGDPRTRYVIAMGIALTVVVVHGRRLVGALRDRNPAPAPTGGSGTT